MPGHQDDPPIELIFNAKSSPQDQNDSSSGLAQSNKRKRNATALAELEVNVDAPEPPSKKALRRAKKGKPAVLKNTTSSPEPSDTENKLVQRASKSRADGQGGPNEGLKPVQDVDVTDSANALPVKRSQYGIWIGNLPWTANDQSLREFLISHAGLDEDEVTRVHMPAPAPGSAPRTGPPGRATPAQNKGFAYVDFASLIGQQAAIGISETDMGGRRVLIKDANSFEGRPSLQKRIDDKDAAKYAADGGTNKPPSRRVFVGNLRFDITPDLLREHFAQCGAVADVFVATFEDSGKCKGYGWVTYEDSASAIAAVRGFIFKDVEPDGEEDQGASNKEKRRKWFVNQLHGQRMRVEFAEDPAFRYKKRFGKQGEAADGEQIAATETVDEPSNVDSGHQASSNVESKHKARPSTTSFQKRADRRLDPRDIKPGAALSKAMDERRTIGAIVAATGKKITFD